jgi:putative transposase
MVAPFLAFLAQFLLPNGERVHLRALCELGFDRSGSISEFRILSRWLDDPHRERITMSEEAEESHFRPIRSQLGPILHVLAKRKERQILEGHLMPGHVHICIAIPPKHAVASVLGFLKGKSAIAIAEG